MNQTQLCIKLRQRLLVVEANIKRADGIDTDLVACKPYYQLYRDELAFQRRFLLGLLQRIEEGEVEGDPLSPGPLMPMYSEGLAL